MFDKLFIKFYNWVGRYRVLILLLLSVLTIASLTRLSTVSFKSNIDLMLPSGSKIARDINFLQNSSFSDKVVVSLKLNSKKASVQQLISAADKLTAELKPPLISSVVSGLGQKDYVGETQKMLDYAPQLITQKELLSAKNKITPTGVKVALSKIYKQLALNPGASFFSSFVRADPLGVKTPLLGSLQSLKAALGYKIDIVDGHFISKDGKHLLLILSTPIKITDIKGSVKLLDYLNSKLKSLPKFVSSSVICGHLHSVSNEHVMKKDIIVIMSIASILFFILFIFWFRSIRAVLVFILPFLGIIISSGICSLFIDNLALFVLGMGAVLAGIAIDYGIHVYIAVRVGGNSSLHMRKIYKPVMIGALTTIGVLASFFFSRVEGYHQLAFFSVISLSICVLCSIFLLPHFFKKDKRHQASGIRQRKSDVLLKPEARRLLPKLLLILWCVFIIVSLLCAMRLKFNNDIVQFDGSKPAIFKAEKRFHEVWGQENQTAILVAQGKTLNGALKANEQLYDDSVMNKMKISSIAPLWPSECTRKVNAKRWVNFWKGGEEGKLKELIKKQSSAYGFSDNAFAPFFQNLYKNVDIKSEQPNFMKDVVQRFIVKKGNVYQILSFFPDTESNVATMNSICKKIPGSFIVSRKSISGLLSQAISSEILYMSLIAAIVIPLLTIIFLRNIIMALIALIPVFSGLFGILGSFVVCGMSFNAPSVISSVVILGLCIDYGIFMVYSCRTKRKTGTKVAVVLSALTTLMGAGGLLFAKHPMLYYVGFTVSVGIFWGVIAAIFIVPAFYKLAYRK